MTHINIYVWVITCDTSAMRLLRSDFSTHLTSCSSWTPSLRNMCFKSLIEHPAKSPADPSLSSGIRKRSSESSRSWARKRSKHTTLVLSYWTIYHDSFSYIVLLRHTLRNSHEAISERYALDSLKLLSGLGQPLPLQKELKSGDLLAKPSEFASFGYQLSAMYTQCTCIYASCIYTFATCI